MRKYFVLALPVVLLGIQIHRPERANPPADTGQAISTKLAVPEEVQSVLNRSCGDCHSNRTVWPWYSNVAPVSWLVAGHVREGREHLNFDDWPGTHKPAKLLDEICEEVEKGGMPLAGYVRLHSAAALSETDKRLICGWTKSSMASLGH